MMHLCVIIRLTPKPLSLEYKWAVGETKHRMCVTSLQICWSSSKDWFFLWDEYAQNTHTSCPYNVTRGTNHCCYHKTWPVMGFQQWMDGCDGVGKINLMAFYL